MDLARSNPGEPSTRRPRSHTVNYPPTAPLSPPRGRRSYDIGPSCVQDIPPLSLHGHTIERPAAVQQIDASSRLNSSRRTLTAPLPVLDHRLTTPVIEPAEPLHRLPAPVIEHVEPLHRPPRSPRERVFAFFGLGRGPEARERKDLVSLMWNFAFNGVQIVVIIALLAYSAHHKSAFDPQISEWTACAKPLGVWDSIWVVKLAIDCGVAYWSFQRDRVTRSAPTSDIESSSRSNPSPPDARNPPHPRRLRNSPTSVSSSRPGASRPAHNLPYSNLYTRLSISLSIFSFIWFIVSNVLIYTSVKTCRLGSPHLWWLTFSVVAITYLMILELLLLGLIVFIIGPIIYLVWNIFLICIGHHPLQNPHYIKPEIGKLPKAVVDRIPLVLYIPHPPEDDQSNDGAISKPAPVHLYPPKPSVPSPRRRFRFLRIKSTKKNRKSQEDKEGNKKALPDSDSWEDNWEHHGEYPFVRLEGNRAACAICLMDFEEPKRIKSHKEDLKEEKREISEKERERKQIREDVIEEDRLRLEDAGEGPQPLRLLACGHVFHQTCLDPWLTGVSGRCPVCQRPVELSEPAKDLTRSRGA